MRSGGGVELGRIFHQFGQKGFVLIAQLQKLYAHAPIRFRGPYDGGSLNLSSFEAQGHVQTGILRQRVHGLDVTASAAKIGANSPASVLSLKFVPQRCDLGAGFYRQTLGAAAVMGSRSNGQGKRRPGWRRGAGLGVWVPRVRGKGAGISAGVLNSHTVEVDSTLRMPICPSTLVPFFPTQTTRKRPFLPFISRPIEADRLSRNVELIHADKARSRRTNVQRLRLRGEGLASRIHSKDAYWHVLRNTWRFSCTHGLPKYADFNPKSPFCCKTNCQALVLGPRWPISRGDVINRERQRNMPLLSELQTGKACDHCIGGEVIRVRLK